MAQITNVNDGYFSDSDSVLIQVPLIRECISALGQLPNADELLIKLSLLVKNIPVYEEYLSPEESHVYIKGLEDAACDESTNKVSICPYEVCSDNYDLYMEGYSNYSRQPTPIQQ